MSWEITDFPIWHPSRMKFDATMIAIAPTGQGKTTFILDCLRKSNVRRGMCVCTSPECYKTYAKHFPILFCHDVLDDKLVARLESILAYQQIKEFEAINESENQMARMETKAKRIQEEEWMKTCESIKTTCETERWSKRKLDREMEAAKKERDEKNAYLKKLRTARYLEDRDRLREKHSWTIVWDDLSNQPGALDSPVIEKSVKAGRHYIEQQFYACQGVKDFKCKNRDQIAWLAMSPRIQMSRHKAFMEDWIPPGFTKPAEFSRVLRMFSDHDWWLVVDRRTKSMDPTKFIYRYKADFSLFAGKPIGCPELLYANQIMFDAQKAQKRMIKLQPDLMRAAALSTGEGDTNEEDAKKKKKRSGTKSSNTVTTSSSTTSTTPKRSTRKSSSATYQEDQGKITKNSKAVKQAMKEQMLRERRDERNKEKAQQFVQMLEKLGDSSASNKSPKGKISRK